MVKISNKKDKIKRILGYFLLFIILILVIILLVRRFSHTEIDDVTPGIQCDDSLLEKSDVLWVIPDFNNQSIANNSQWCNKILSLNKTLGMHGVHHYYNEFSYPLDKEYIELGINDFEKCFGYKPTLFKAPQLNLSINNEKILESMDFKVKKKINQLTHKVYHCSDTGMFSNRLIDWF